MEAAELIRFTFCHKRKEGVSEEEFHRHWSETHGPLVSQVLLRAGVVKYVQVRNASVASDSSSASS
jgi:hypothetical protein